MVLSTRSIVPLLIFAGALLFVGAVAWIDGDQDACGDRLPNDADRADPMRVIDYLRNSEVNQRAQNGIENHPMLQDLEAGKLQRNVMQRFVINAVYHLEECLRALHGARDLWGAAFPQHEARQIVEMAIDVHRNALNDAEGLARRFDINRVEDLMVHDPDYLALFMVNHMHDTVHHAQDVSELLAPVILRLQLQSRVMQRMKDALANNAAYKAWGVTADDLRFFDDLIIQDDVLKQIIELARPVIQRSIDRRVTLCQIRRRNEALAVGQLAFFDATNTPGSKQPIPRIGGREGF